MGEHCTLLVVLKIVTVVVMLLTFTFNALSNGVKPLFPSTTGNLSDKYETGITPSGWTFSIWGFIYTWQVLWVGFSIVNVFRKTQDGPAYLNPLILTPVVFMIYIFNLGCNTAWIFLFGYEHVIPAFVALFLIAFTLYIIMFITHKNLYKYAPLLKKEGRCGEIWLHRLLVHNGLGIYATWTTIATLLNVVMVMVYRSDPGVGLEDAGTVALSILTVEISIFVVSDLFFLDKYTRYTVTPYMVVCVALGGSIDKNWSPGMRNSIFTVSLLGIACAALVLKVILLVYRHFKTPMYPSVITPTTSENAA